MKKNCFVEEDCNCKRNDPLSRSPNPVSGHRNSVISCFFKGQQSKAMCPNSKRKALKPRARLTEGQVIYIFKSKLSSPQLSATVLASLYRVGEKTIRDIWKSRTWSRATLHLDESRTLQFKQPGRPKGCREPQPRFQASGVKTDESSSEGHCGHGPDWKGLTTAAFELHRLPSDADLQPTWSCQLNMQGCRPVGSSSWNQSDPNLLYNPLRCKTAWTQLHTSIDEQLCDWNAFWRSCPLAD